MACDKFIPDELEPGDDLCGQCFQAEEEHEPRRPRLSPRLLELGKQLPKPEDDWWGLVLDGIHQQYEDYPIDVYKAVEQLMDIAEELQRIIKEANNAD